MGDNSSPSAQYANYINFGYCEMGEVVRRKTEIATPKAKNAAWLDPLPHEKRVIATVAQATYDRVVVG